MAVDVEYKLKRLFCVNYKQQDALDRLNGHTNSRVFSFESPRFKTGCRKFVTADLRKFYVSFYRNYEKPRHFYEIILENVPCRMYFDLEYYRQFNTNINDMQILDDFLGTAILSFQELFSVTMSRNDFLILDSSNDDKFSAHVIVHFPGDKLFPSNVEMKHIVMYICRKMLEHNVGLVRGEKPDDVRFICDLAVYSKNRNFRLFLSSKCGKNSVLTLADYCTFYSNKEPCRAEIFLDSLIIPKDYKRFEVLKIPSINIPLPPSKTQTGIHSSLKEVGNLIKPFNQSHTISDVRELKSGRVPSPFPELDDYMIKIFKELNPNATIRLWRLILMKSTNSRILQYQLWNCRFCYNKNREHKSQNTYWSVDLDEFFYVQRCFDVIDCFKFSSKRFPIPLFIVEQIAKRINKIFERLCHDAAYTESFYSSYYDRLFYDLLIPNVQLLENENENDSVDKKNDDVENLNDDVIILS